MPMKNIALLEHLLKSMPYRARYDECQLITILCLTLNYPPYEM